MARPWCFPPGMLQLYISGWLAMTLGAETAARQSDSMLLKSFQPLLEFHMAVKGGDENCVW